LVGGGGGVEFCLRLTFLIGQLKFQPLLFHFYLLYSKNFLPLGALQKANKILSRIKEIEMKISSAKIQNHCSKISISSDQKLFSEEFLCKMGFELNEIWQKDSCPETHIWLNPATNEIVSVELVECSKTAQSTNDTDDTTTRGDLLVEVIDLWFELRAIRDLLASDTEIPLAQTTKEESVQDRFFDAVETVKSQCGDFEENIKELFGVEIDAESLAFLSLPSSDKSLLCN
jgi:hypothetical protein